MISTTTEKVIKELKKADLSIEDRVALVTILLDKLGAFPIGEMVQVSLNGIAINGKELDGDQVLNFRESASLLKENFARKVINEQLKFKAMEMGIHKSTTIEQLLFAKAVIWFINEENILLQSLSEI
jgi:hypothetical protein